MKEIIISSLSPVLAKVQIAKRLLLTKQSLNPNITPKIKGKMSTPQKKLLENGRVSLSVLFGVIFFILIMAVGIGGGYSIIYEGFYSDINRSFGRRLITISTGLFVLGFGLSPLAFFLLLKFGDSPIFIAIARITVASFGLTCPLLFSIGFIAEFRFPSGNIGHGFYSGGAAVFKLLGGIGLIILGFLIALLALFWAIWGYKDTFKVNTGGRN